MKEIHDATLTKKINKTQLMLPIVPLLNARWRWITNTIQLYLICK